MSLAATGGDVTSKTLDDYEEGTTEASFTCGSGTAPVVSGYETLSYTKIGRLVSVTGRIAVGTVSAASGSLKLNGLPFTVGNALRFQGGCAMFAPGMSGMTGIIIGTVIANTTTIDIYRTVNAGATQNDVSSYLLTNSSEFWVSFTYMTD
jgi:hypothetical protein